MAECEFNWSAQWKDKDSLKTIFPTTPVESLNFQYLSPCDIFLTFI